MLLSDLVNSVQIIIQSSNISASKPLLFFLITIILFIWLHWVLVVAGRVFNLPCIMLDL